MRHTEPKLHGLKVAIATSRDLAFPPNTELHEPYVEPSQSVTSRSPGPPSPQATGHMGRWALGHNVIVTWGGQWRQAVVERPGGLRRCK